MIRENHTSLYDMSSTIAHYIFKKGKLELTALLNSSKSSLQNHEQGVLKMYNMLSAFCATVPGFEKARKCWGQGQTWSSLTKRYSIQKILLEPQAGAGARIFPIQSQRLFCSFLEVEGRS